MKRLFLALPIPDGIADLIMPLQKDVIGARFSPRENLHITLRFIGDMETASIADLANNFSAIDVPSFELELSGAGYFGNQMPHSLHLKLKENSALFELASQCENICRDFGIPADTRKYIPHLTLAYLSPQTKRQDAENFVKLNAEFSTKVWRADHFHLYASRLNDGPSVYNIEKSYCLG